MYSDENAEKADIKGQYSFTSSGDDWHMIDQPMTNYLSGVKTVFKLLDPLRLNETVTVS